MEHTVLVVDDEQGLLDVYEEALGGRGYRVLRASNGEEALERLREHPVDLVLTDLKMPRMGGMELLCRIKESGMDPDVIFLTGYGNVENAVECLQLGASDYLLKPFQFQQLFQKIDKALSERNLRSQQELVGDMLGVLRLSTALNRHDDPNALLKELLLHVKDTFSPDGLALFLPAGRNGDLESRMLWGGFFKNDPKLCAWVRHVAERLYAQSRPRLLERVPARFVDGAALGERAVSLMIVPLVGGAASRTGAVAVVRENGRPYAFRDLQLLTIFASHAAPSVESVRYCKRLQTMNMEIIRSYARAVEAKDIYTRGHSERVSEYASVIGRELGLNGDDLELLSTAGMLHDIGKIGIPDGILNKPASLTDVEYDIMKEHPAVGTHILSRISALAEVIPLIHHHHERYDGRGYPDGLRGDEIPYLARILSVVDGFEALTSSRAYHRARSVEEALTILIDGSGTQWDPNVVETLVRLVREERLGAVCAC